ncbi:MAG: SMC-Scp complex subunit ScpB [Candidatus Brockarchaeota archaeon]|nr:SMC-Scp complex subunit ScpB [Candidatus Brockarchaeota archaeon]
MTDPEEERAKNAIEAALFVAGRPLDVETLGSVCKLRSREKTKKLSRAVAERYRRNGGAVEVVELPDERFVMRVKSEYAEMVRRVSARPLVTRGALRTLSLVALKQPLTQSQLVRMRGPQAYDHVKELTKGGLLKGVKVGRTLLLSTTAMFSDMFNLSRDPSSIKRQLQEMMERAASQKPGEREAPGPEGEGEGKVTEPE